MIGMPGYVVVLPVKRLALAKSRLAPGLSEQAHRRLALCLALDTACAVVGSAGPAGSAGSVLSVLAVTDDADAAAALSRIGVATVPDVPDAGLNPALAHGAEVALARHPDASVALLAADLPALLPTELSAALTAASRHPRAFLADRNGTGTTLLCAQPGVPARPEFGRDSRRAHLASGAVELHGPWPTLRGDVDTLADLRRAAAGGLGHHLRELLADLSRHGQDLLGSHAGLQATVSRYDEDRQTGTALLDDGTRVSFSTAAAHAGGWRFLRAGQRVSLTIGPDGGVLRVGRPV
jgi:2-phospho-L-lactate guanylyltransferase